MSEFVGRTGSLRVYSYPEAPRGGGALALARNYATGVKGGGAGVGAGTQIPWNSIDVGPDPSFDVQITPLSTGQLLVSGVVTLVNTTGASITASVKVQLDGGDIPVPIAVSTVPSGDGAVAIPFLVETEIISPLNELHRIQVFVTGNGLTIVSGQSVVNVQEVPVSTG